MSSQSLNYQREYNVPAFVALFYVVHYACHNGIYFHLEYHGMEPESEVMPPFPVPSIHPSTSAFIGLGPIHVPDKASSTVWKRCGMAMCTFNNRLLLKKVCSICSPIAGLMVKAFCQGLSMGIKMDPSLWTVDKKTINGMVLSIFCCKEEI